MIATIPTKDQFLLLANGKCQVRLLGSADYTLLCDACRSAFSRATRNLPYFTQGTAAPPSKRNGYPFDTSGWAVWVDPVTLTVRWSVGRIRSSHDSIGCVYPGGGMAYFQDWESCTARREKAAAVYQAMLHTRLLTRSTPFAKKRAWITRAKEGYRVDLGVCPLCGHGHLFTEIAATKHCVMCESCGVQTKGHDNPGDAIESCTFLPGDAQ